MKSVVSKYRPKASVRFSNQHGALDSDDSAAILVENPYNFGYVLAEITISGKS